MEVVEVWIEASSSYHKLTPYCFLPESPETHDQLRWPLSWSRHWAHNHTYSLSTTSGHAVRSKLGSRPQAAMPQLQLQAQSVKFPAKSSWWRHGGNQVWERAYLLPTGSETETRAGQNANHTNRLITSEGRKFDRPEKCAPTWAQK